MHSQTPDIIPFISSVKRRLFSDAQLAMLKRNVIRILAERGIHFPSKKALSIFADHGAQVDGKNEIVKIPPEIVEKAISTAPRSFVLAGRDMLALETPFVTINATDMNIGARFGFDQEQFDLLCSDLSPFRMTWSSGDRCCVG